MRKPILVALVAGSIVAGGIAAMAPGAGAQPVPPAEGRPPMGAPDERPPGPLGGPMGGLMGGPMGMRDAMRRHNGWMQRLRQFALVYPVQDRALGGADVQKIAEAFLLLNGNHTWKITEVSEEPDRVLFALATSDGTAIAHFAMNRHTARPQRLS